ncbi:MAG TPA: hypothetical protein VFH51_07645, partial [Myxococcota bacterium]|nr:hypothetical protein [Myxococcota bacterium]
MNKTVGLIKDAVLAPCLGTTKFFYKADILKQPKLGLRRRLMHIAYEGAISQAAQLGRVVAGLARHEAWSQAAHAELRAEQGRAATALEALGQRVEFGLQQYAGAVDAATAGASSAFLTYRDEFRALARRIFKDELAPLQGYANLLFQAYWARAAAEPRTLDRLLETFASVHR